MKLRKLDGRTAIAKLAPDYVVPSMSDDKKRQLEFMERASKVRDYAQKRRMLPEAYVTFFGSVTAACEALDIGTNTYYGWLRDDEKFAESIRLAEMSLVDNARYTIHSQAKNGHTIAGIFVLKTHDPRFSEKTNDTITKATPSFSINFNGTSTSWDS